MAYSGYLKYIKKGFKNISCVLIQSTDSMSNYRGTRSYSAYLGYGED